MIANWLTLAGVIIALATLILGITKLNAIHVLVNSRLTAVINRVAQLVVVLRSNGIAIPEDPDEQQRENPDVG